jgi:hypothetical protein
MSSALPEIEGQTIRRNQQVRPRCNRTVEYVSQTYDARARRSTYRYLNRRALVEMQKKVVKRGKRNRVFRFVLSKDDKDKIADWKQDLARILQIFNVRLIDSAGNSLT